MFLQRHSLVLIFITTILLNTSAEDAKPRISEIKCLEYQEIYRKLLLNPFPPDEDEDEPEVIDFGLICPDLRKGSRKKRVVGGDDALPGEFPHMAYIELRNKKNDIFKCGGTLISPDYVLTAASSFYNNTFVRDREPSRIVLGDINLEEDKKATTRRVFSEFKWTIHPDYLPKEDGEYNDIALIKLIKSDLNFSARIKPNLSIRPACLPPVGKEIIQDRVLASGWGYNMTGAS